MPNQALQRTGSVCGFKLLSKFQARRQFGRQLNASSLGSKITMTPEQIAETVRATLDELDSRSVSPTEREIRISFAHSLFRKMDQLHQSAIFGQEIAALQQRLDEIGR